MGKGLLLLVACALSCAARAQPTEPKWEFGMGATGFRIPDYRGSDQNRYYLLPIPYFVYRGDKVRVDRQGPRAKVFESPRLELDFSAVITPPVDSSKNHAREGMPDLDPTVELGPQINFIVARDLVKDWRFDLRLPVRAVVATDIKHSRGAGYTVFPHAYYSGHPELFGASWNLGMTAGLLFGSRDYHNYFYTVAPQFATAERRPTTRRAAIPARWSRARSAGASASCGRAVSCATTTCAAPRSSRAPWCGRATVSSPAWRSHGFSPNPPSGLPAASSSPRADARNISRRLQSPARAAGSCNG